MKNRFFALALSILVLVVTLAGLLAIITDLEIPPSIPLPVFPDGQTNGQTNGQTAGIPPLFEVTGAATTSLLRNIATSYYDGEMWRRQGNAEHYIYEGETLSPPVTSYSRQRVDDIVVKPLIEFPTGTVPLPTSLYTIYIFSDVPLLYFPEEQVFYSEEGFPDYAFRAAHYDFFDDSVLLDAEIDPQDIYLQLPAAITQRTRELALTITKDSKTPYQKARAIENYLKANYVYDSDYERAPEGWEPNDWFLFEERSGGYTNFNSAFVILSRSVGIPARLVGGFRIKPQQEKQVVYADQAYAWSEVKFKDLGWYTFDVAGRPDRLPTITKITSVPPVLKKGYSFNVRGTVRTENGNPVDDGLRVKVFINSQKETKGGLLIGEGITSKGYFDIEAIIPAEEAVGDYRILAHFIGTTKYQESWSNHIIKVVTATNLSLQVPSRVEVQETIILKGNLSEEFGQPLAGQQIDIYLADKKVAELTTDEDSHFVWEQVLNDAGAYTVKASFAGTDYYLESNQEVEFQVLTPTNIKLDVISPDAAAGAIVDEQVVIVGSLFETITNMPLQGQEIEILIDGESTGDKIVTDEEGSFEIKHTFGEVGRYQIEAKFSSVPFYWESSTKTDLEVFPTPGGFIWSYLIIVLTLALAGIGGFFIYRWQKQRRLLLAPIAIRATSEAQATPLPQVEKPSREVSLNIEFPQIKSPFPDVWGLDDDLEIVCHLIDPQDDRLAAKPLEVYIGNELVAQLTTDESGTVKLHYTFAEKGQYELLVRLKEEPGIKDVMARRTLRIVDYREEIVNLFEMLVNWLRDLGIQLGVKSTPREIEYRVLNAGKGIPRGDMDKVVSCFEEADYSLHDINRGNYQTMYLAQREIREHGGELAGES